MNTKRSHGYLLFAGLVLFSALQACGDDDGENAKPPVVTPTAGSSGKSNNTAGSQNNTGGDGSTDVGGTTGTGGKSGGKAGNGSTAGKGSVDPVGGDGQGGNGPDQPACTLPEKGKDGCFNCPENGVIEQWLNRCVDSDCEPFDNKRLPLLKADGSLPPLPT